MEPHPRLLSRKDRLKTIITSDTYDVNPSENTLSQENKPRNGSFMRTQHSLKKPRHKENNTKKQHKSISSAYGHSIIRDNTPRPKHQRLMSISHHQDRLNTDHSEMVHPFTFKRMVSELKKNVVYPVKD